MTEIKRGITIEGQKALDIFHLQMEDEINHVMRNITYTLSGGDDLDLNADQRQNMSYHIFYLKMKLYNNVVNNILKPLLDTDFNSEEKHD